MKTIYLSSFLSLVSMLLLSIAGCKDETKSPPADSAPDPIFLKCWTHAFEEDGQDNIRIFRSCMNHTFPIARYRNTFTLKENWEVEYTTLAPNDAHTTEAGKWTYDSRTKKLRISNKEGGLVKEYEVLEYSDDLLKLKE